MKSFTGFRLSLFSFLDRHPLYPYRDDAGELKVLLIGYGQRILDDILPTVATNGQLLDTTLHITLASSNPSQCVDTLLQKVPYLPHFSAISCMNKRVSESEMEDNRCTLSFEKAQLTAEGMQQLAGEHSDYRYVIISTGTDEKNAELARAFGSCGCDETVLIAYVQRKKKPGLTMPSTEQAELIPFGFDADGAEFSEELEKIGLNLHSSYIRSADSRYSANSVLHDFYHDKYTYVSNMEAAIHIKAKLLCCGISCSDLKQAAKEFSARVAKDPTLIDRLASIEHDRWVFSKIFAGYRQLQDQTLIYRDGNTTHSSAQKWHTCLLPVDHTGASSITKEIWQAAESGTVSDSKLDPLDQMTLLLHQKCRENAEAHTGTVDSLLKTIQDLLADNASFPLSAYESFKQLSLAVSELRIHKRSAISLYRRSWKKLYDQIRADDGVHAAVLTSILDNLQAEMGSLIEYVSRKDYKEQDRILCRGIPYALTHQFRPVVLKLLSSKTTDNIASIQQMDPAAVTFVGIARTAMELAQIDTVLANLKRYVSHYLQETEFKYSIFVPNELCGTADEEREDLVFVPLLERKALVDEMSMLFSAAPAYIDVSGADPLLTAAAMEYADTQGCGVFYNCGGTFLNISRAEELEYPFPKQGFTVEQMFSINGADTIGVESSRITGLENIYQPLWDLFLQNSMYWNTLPDKRIALPDDRTYTFPFAGEGGEVTIRTQQAVAQKLFPVLQQMVQLQYIRDISFDSVYGSARTILFSVRPGITDAAQFQTALQSLCDGFDPQTMTFSLNYNHKTLQVSGLRCTVSLADDNPAYLNGHKAILQRLTELGGIYDIVYSDPKTCTFRLASPEMRHIMEKAGNLAEAYVYYTALLDCGFDDVENGLSFRHSVGSEIRNEIDVLCTSADRSLFISVKARNESAFADPDLNYLNMVAYEIRYEAEHFGLNSKAVLAAPALPMFTLAANGTYVLSTYAMKCRSRGVYLCGRECFQSGMLGRTLTAIMNDADDTWSDLLRPAAGTAAPAAEVPSATVPVPADTSAPTRTTEPDPTPAADSIPAQIIPFENLAEGQVYYGKIVGIIPKSAFVEIGVRHKGTVVNGALFISDIADCYVSDIHDFVQEGDVVKVVVTQIDPQKTQFRVSMKQCRNGN